MSPSKWTLTKLDYSLFLVIVMIDKPRSPVEQSVRQLVNCRVLKDLDTCPSTYQGTWVGTYPPQPQSGIGILARISAPAGVNFSSSPQRNKNRYGNPQVPRMFSANHSNAGGDWFCSRGFNYRWFSVLCPALANHQALFQVEQRCIRTASCALADPGLGARQGAP